MVRAKVLDEKKTVHIYFLSKHDREVEHKFIVDLWHQSHNCIEIADRLNRVRGDIAKAIFSDLKLEQKGFTYYYDLFSARGVPTVLAREGIIPLGIVQEMKDDISKQVRKSSFS